MANKKKSSEFELPVSKQTAGGVTGAVLGGMVAGPVGAIVGGVAGAMVGEASAKGKQPMKTAIDKVKAIARSREVSKASATLTRKAKGLVSKARKKITRAVGKKPALTRRTRKR